MYTIKFIYGEIVKIEADEILLEANNPATARYRFYKNGDAVMIIPFSNILYIEKEIK